MKTTVEVFVIATKTPADGEKVAVWNERCKEWEMLCYNKHYDCWDDEDGDDYNRDINPGDTWFSLPAAPDKL